MDTMQHYLTLCCSEQWQGGIFQHVLPDGDTLRLEEGCTSGVYCMPPLDSGENGFTWSRVIVDALLPEDSAIRVYAWADDETDGLQWGELGERLASHGQDPVPLLRKFFGPPAAASLDFYLSCSGRHLWLALELNATGEDAPVIRGFSFRMGGDHMADYLPAIYQEDSFTRRFLSIFDSMLMDMEREICALPGRLDFESAGADTLCYLASWVCVDESSPDKLRQRLYTALPDYETMYTPAGIKRSIRRLTGREALLIEHFSVDPNLPDCRNPELYRRLYGEDPYRFFALLEDGAFPSRDLAEAFLDEMQSLIPAGAELELVLLKPCVQLDRHTYLGINSKVGGYIPAVIDENMTIHYDTTIGGAIHESF